MANTPILICGSMAYDTIMNFPDQFRSQILPEQLHVLSVSFLVPEMRRELGGCAGNIAYTLKMIGGEPLIMATVGNDFAPYAKRLDSLGIRRDYLRELPDCFTGQAFVTTDVDNNQIAAFHPGAMMFSHYNKIVDLKEPVALAIVSPDGKQGMMDHCEQLAAAGIPFIFDPGQGLPMFTGAELMRMVGLSSYLTVNDYEAQMLQNRTGLSIEALADEVRAMVVTLGAEGSRIYAEGEIYDIPVVPVTEVVDPTGCGDAFRAGLLYGISHGWDWPTTGRLASLVAARKIACRGGQNHQFTPTGLAAQYQLAFGSALPSA